MQQCPQPQRIAAFSPIACALVPNALLIPMPERELKKFVQHGEIVSRIQIDHIKKSDGSIAEPGYIVRISLAKSGTKGQGDTSAAEFTLLRQRGGIRTWKRLDLAVAWAQRALPKLKIKVIEVLVK